MDESAVSDAGLMQTSPFEAGTGEEDRVESQTRATTATVGQHKNLKVTQKMFLQEHDEVGSTVAATLDSIKDRVVEELLGNSYQLLSHERKVKVDAVFSGIRMKAYKIVQRWGESKAPGDDEVLDRTLIDPQDLSAFLASSQESGASLDSSFAPPLASTQELGHGQSPQFGWDVEVEDTVPPMIPMDEDEVGDVGAAGGCSGRGRGRRPGSRASLHDVQRRRRYDRIEPYRNDLAGWAAIEGVDSISQLCGLIIYYENYITNRKQSDVGWRIWKGEEVAPLSKVSVEEATYIQERLKVRTEAYRGIKFLIKDRIWFPGKNEVAAFKFTLRPALYNDHVLHDAGGKRGYEGGPRYKLDSALAQTLSEHLTLQKIANKSFSRTVEFKLCIGYDGCSSHSSYMQAEENKSMLLGMFVVTEITDHGTKNVIWTCRDDGGFNSIYNTRPLCIVPQEESRTVMDNLLNGIKAVPASVGEEVDQTATAATAAAAAAPSIPGVDEEIASIMANGLTFNLRGEDAATEMYHAKLVEKPDPVGDGKMAKLVTGLGGAYCLCCTFTPKDCKTRSMILEGFPINRTIEQCLEVANEHLVRRARDYGDRHGHTHKAITILNWTRHIAIMHAKIHVLRYLSELLWRIIANCTHGVDYWFSAFLPAPETRPHRHPKTGKPLKGYVPEEKDAIDAGERKVKEHAKKEIHIDIFEPNNMETGNMFERFAWDGSRQKMAELIVHDDAEIQEKYREAWMSIHLDLCALTIVGQSQRTKVDVARYKEISTRVYLRIVDEFPWSQGPNKFNRKIWPLVSA